MVPSQVDMDFVRRLADQAERAAETLVERNARIRELEDLLRRCYRVVGSDELARDIERAVPDV